MRWQLMKRSSGAQSSALEPLVVESPRPRVPGRMALAVGAAVVGTWVVVALASHWLAPYDPLQVKLEAELQPPGRLHWLGTDPDGIDILSRLLFGARLSIGVGIATVAISSSLGTLLGVIAGYTGGRVDRMLGFLTDVVMAFPGILLPLAFTALSPWKGAEVVILALCIGGWVGYCRMARAQVLILRERAFIIAAEAAGLPPGRILWRYVLPNILGPLLVQASFGFAGAIMAEAGLSFLGLGVEPGTPSWGSMLNQGRHYLLVAPHLSLYPGFAIVSVVFGFNLLGDGLRDRLAPHHP